MDQEAYTRAKKASDRAGIVVFLVFLAWLPTYLIVVRPVLNNWLAQYINSYPAMLHLVPIIGLPVLIALVLSKFFPPPKANDAQSGVGS
jgi:hypothetical protein